MPKNQEICLSRSEQNDASSSGSAGAFLEGVVVSLETVFRKKELIDCAALSKKSGKELWGLSESYAGAIVTLSMDGLDSVGPQVFALSDDIDCDLAYKGTGSLAG